MFNLNSNANTTYNGISQLPENEYIFSDGTESTSKKNVRAYPSEQGAVRSGLSNGKGHSKLKSNSIEDVYAFNDSDQPVDSHFRKSPIYKTDGTIKKNMTGSLMTSPKKVQIVKPINGFKMCRDAAGSFNGRAAVPECSKPFNRPLQKLFIKKDPFPSVSYVREIKSESDVISSKLHNNGLNNFTKNSIINSNVKPVISKTNMLCQSKKPGEILVKYEPARLGIKAENPSSHSSYLNKNNSKLLSKKILAGKSIPKPNKVRKGRGPALHESLQRITPSKSFDQSIPEVDAFVGDRWHSPGTEIFDCGVLDSYKIDYLDSDSSDDDIFDHVDHWLVESNFEVSSKNEKSSLTKASLRRQITQLKQLQVISSSPKSSVALYNSIKTQMMQHKQNAPGQTYRVRGSALKLLLGLNKKSVKKHKFPDIKSDVNPCAHMNCDAPALNCSQFCLAHMTHVKRQIPEPIVNFANKNHVFNMNAKNQLTLLNEAWKKDQKLAMQNSKPKRPSRSKRPSVPAPSKSLLKNSLEAGKNIPTTGIEAKSVNGGKHFVRYPDNSNYYVPGGIERAETLMFNQNNPDLNVCSNSSSCENPEDSGIGGLTENELIASVNNPQHIDPDVVAEVFAMHETEVLPSLDLPSSDQPQEPNIDLSTVFNDIFTEPNSEYVPSKEETEELERALEAVSQDVKSLENLAGSQHILDSFLDERVFAETLASLPDVFNNIPIARNVADPTPSTS